jgi:hypothetical protein
MNGLPASANAKDVQIRQSLNNCGTGQSARFRKCGDHLVVHAIEIAEECDGVVVIGIARAE